ncbi:MAG: hypothetical protein M3441_00965 [Chloroflexota bacterium]|nr:hypothetical protein [Chloroflexota bacterium]
MTYILGLQMRGFNAIIADQRATSGNDGSNDSVKTGVLFPGCIYGRIGSERQSARFIRAVTLGIQAGKCTRISDAWAYLESYADSFAYADGENDAFILLLSSRVSGTPRFYELRSGEGIRPWPEEGVGIRTYGSGAAILDDYVAGKAADGLPHPMGMSFIERAEVAQKDMLAAGFTSDTVTYTTPYMLCLWLTELTINYERTRLEACGVGGMFYHILQTSQAEGTPYAALYVFTRPEIVANRRTLYFAWFRTAQAGNGLYVERFVAAGFDSDTPTDVIDKRIVIDVVSRPDLIGDYDQDALYKEMEAELNAQHYAYFVGIGQYEPDHRAQATFLLPGSASRADILDERGGFTPYVMDAIKAGYPGVDFSNMV